MSQPPPSADDEGTRDRVSLALLGAGLIVIAGTLAALAWLLLGDGV